MEISVGGMFPELAEEFAKQKSQKHETRQILSSWRGREDSNYVPGMQFCRTSLRRGQERSSEGRPDSPPMSRNVVRERKRVT